jgi:hypothetical protein
VERGGHFALERQGTHEHDPSAERFSRGLPHAVKETVVRLLVNNPHMRPMNAFKEMLDLCPTITPDTVTVKQVSDFIHNYRKQKRSVLLANNVDALREHLLSRSFHKQFRDTPRVRSRGGGGGGDSDDVGDDDDLDDPGSDDDTGMSGGGEPAGGDPGGYDVRDPFSHDRPPLQSDVDRATGHWQFRKRMFVLQFAVSDDGQSCSIVLSTPALLRNCKPDRTNGQVFFDHTFRLNHEKWPLGVLGTCDCQGRLHPIAYHLTTSKDAPGIQVLLRSVKRYASLLWGVPDWFALIRITMADEAESIRLAFDECFPHAKRMGCWWHIKFRLNKTGNATFIATLQDPSAITDINANLDAIVNTLPQPSDVTTAMDLFLGELQAAGEGAFVEAWVHYYGDTTFQRGVAGPGIPVIDFLESHNNKIKSEWTDRTVRSVQEQIARARAFMQSVSYQGSSSCFWNARGRSRSCRRCFSNNTMSLTLHVLTYLDFADFPKHPLEVTKHTSEHVRSRIFGLWAKYMQYREEEGARRYELRCAVGAAVDGGRSYAIPSGATMVLLDNTYPPVRGGTNVRTAFRAMVEASQDPNAGQEESLDDFLRRRTSVYIVTSKPGDTACSTCTCPAYLRNLQCKHETYNRIDVLGTHTVPPEVLAKELKRKLRATPLGANAKPGRKPKQRGGALRGTGRRRQTFRDHPCGLAGVSAPPVRPVRPSHDEVGGAEGSAALGCDGGGDDDGRDGGGDDYGWDHWGGDDYGSDEGADSTGGGAPDADMDDDANGMNAEEARADKEQMDEAKAANLRAFQKQQEEAGYGSCMVDENGRLMALVQVEEAVVQAYFDDNGISKQIGEAVRDGDCQMDSTRQQHPRLGSKETIRRAVTAFVRAAWPAGLENHPRLKAQFDPFRTLSALRDATAREAWAQEFSERRKWVDVDFVWATALFLGCNAVVWAKASEITQVEGATHIGEPHITEFALPNPHASDPAPTLQYLYVGSHYVPVFDTPRLRNIGVDDEGRFTAVSEWAGHVLVQCQGRSCRRWRHMPYDFADKIGVRGKFTCRSQVDLNNNEMNTTCNTQCDHCHCGSSCACQ